MCTYTQLNWVCKSFVEIYNVCSTYFKFGLRIIQNMGQSKGAPIYYYFSVLKIVTYVINKQMSDERNILSINL